MNLHIFPAIIAPENVTKRKHKAEIVFQDAFFLRLIIIQERKGSYDCNYVSSQKTRPDSLACVEPGCPLFSNEARHLVNVLRSYSRINIIYRFNVLAVDRPNFFAARITVIKRINGKVNKKEIKELTH